MYVFINYLHKQLNAILVNVKKFDLAYLYHTYTLCNKIIGPYSTAIKEEREKEKDRKREKEMTSKILL